MTAPNDEDVQHWIDLIAKTKRRLYVLEDQLATYGANAPPHIQTEAIQARKDIELYRARLVTVPPSDKANEEVGGNAHQILVDYRLTLLEKKVSDGLAAVLETVTRNNAAAEEWRRGEKEIRKERQEEHDARLTKVEQQTEVNTELTIRIADQLQGLLWRVALVVVVALVVALTLAKAWGL